MAIIDLNHRLKEIGRREGITCVDLATLLPKSLQVFYDDCHFNETGTVRVAHTLAQTLGPLLEVSGQRGQDDHGAFDSSSPFNPASQ